MDDERLSYLILRGSEVEINNEKYNITPGIQKVLVDSKYKTAKSMSDMEKLVFRGMLRKTNYYNRTPTKGRLAGRDIYFVDDLDVDVRRILNLDTKRSCKGNEKTIIHSNKIDIYTRLENLLGLKFSG